MVANETSLHKIRSFSLLEPPCSSGTKLCLRINNFTLLAVYIPPSSPHLLQLYANQARSYAAAGTPVVLCGDLNAHSMNLGASFTNEAGTYLDNLLLPNGPASFFRANTGPEATRPNSSATGGSIIDFIIASNSDINDGRCYAETDWPSDHRPISCQITPLGPRPDKSTSHFRFRLEHLSDPVILDSNRRALQTAAPALEDRIRDLSCQVNYLSPLSAKLSIIDAIELSFVTSIIAIAKDIIGKKRVPILNSGPYDDPSREYIQAGDHLQSIYSTLRTDRTLDPSFVTDLLALAIVRPGICHSTTTLKKRL